MVSLKTIQTEFTLYMTEFTMMLLEEILKMVVKKQILLSLMLMTT